AMTAGAAAPANGTVFTVPPGSRSASPHDVAQRQRYRAQGPRDPVSRRLHRPAGMLVRDPVREPWASRPAISRPSAPTGTNVAVMTAPIDATTTPAWAELTAASE